MFNLSGKKALVTGSTQGIGLEIARVLAKAGATVFVHGRSMEKCAAAAKAVGGVPVVADLCNADCAETLYKQTGEIDILVQNASLQLRDDIMNVPDEDFDAQYHVNLRSTLRLVQTYLPHMKQQGWGRIVAVGSINQYKQNTSLALYATSKSAQFNLVQSLARDYSRYGITVNGLAPGVIATPRNEDVLADKEKADAILKQIPAKRLGRAEDIAPACLLLCSEEGGYITGTDLIVDGGMHL